MLPKTTKKQLKHVYIRNEDNKQDHTQAVIKLRKRKDS